VSWAQKLGSGQKSQWRGEERRGDERIARLYKIVVLQARKLPQKLGGSTRNRGTLLLWNGEGRKEKKNGLQIL
jgi:hypothetical protein